MFRRHRKIFIEKETPLVIDRTPYETRVRLKIYGDFLNSNSDLFRRDPTSYWRECGKYYERRWRNVLDEIINEDKDRMKN